MLERAEIRIKMHTQIHTHTHKNISKQQIAAAHNVGFNVQCSFHPNIFTTPALRTDGGMTSRLNLIVPVYPTTTARELSRAKCTMYTNDLLGIQQLTGLEKKWLVSEQTIRTLETVECCYDYQAHWCRGQPNNITKK